MSDWRKQDTRYAVAIGFAGLALVYLIAAGFGLVSSPLPRASQIPVTDVRAIDVQPVDVATSQEPATAVIAGLITPPTPQPTAAAPAARPAPIVDVTPPTSTFATQSGALIVGVLGSKLEGSSTDDLSGVAKVLVSFVPTVAAPSTVEASLTCADASRRSCTWKVDPPQVLGTYTVHAQAVDRAGNIEPTGPAPITISGVTAPLSTPEPLAPVTDTVGGVVGTAGGLVGGVVGVVGGLLGIL